MNERQIQDVLWTTLNMRGHRWICPNYTPRNWFECDVFSVTKAGFMVEHEIKLTISDFKADASKGRPAYAPTFDDLISKRTWNEELKRYELPTIKKHSQLAAAYTKGPSRFFYVVPEGLVKECDIPSWAGLIWAFPYGKRVCTKIVKPAPKLHTAVVDPEVIKHVSGIFYWRFWNFRQRKEVSK